MEEPELHDPAPSPRAQRKEKLLWLASLGLAVLVICCGCGFFFTVGLMSRGELTANVLGTEWRLWRIAEKRETGLGLDRSFAIRRADRSCTQHDTTLLLWKPVLSLDNVVFDDCS